MKQSPVNSNLLTFSIRNGCRNLGGELNPDVFFYFKSGHVWHLKRWLRDVLVYMFDFFSLKNSIKMLVFSMLRREAWFGVYFISLSATNTMNPSKVYLL